MTVDTNKDSSNSRPELSAKPANFNPILYGGIAAGVVLLLIAIGAIWAAWAFPPITVAIRDVVFVILGLTLVITVLLLIALVVAVIYLILKINDLIQLMDRDVRPLIGKVNDNLTTVQGTTNFISEQAVKPIISTASTVAAVRATVNALFKR